MDPDVAHPRHQSNQTVRNRGEGERLGEGDGVVWVRRGWEGLPPPTPLWLQGCFFPFLRWSGTDSLTIRSL